MSSTRTGSGPGPRRTPRRGPGADRTTTERPSQRLARRRTFLHGLAFASPWLLGFAAFIATPIALSAYYSFTDFNIFQAPTWVGLDNYTALLGTERFWKAAFNTVYLTVIGVPLGLVLALAIALVLNLPIRGQALYRAVVYLPSIVPLVVGVYVWRWLLNAQYGYINAALGALGLPQPLWLDDPTWTKPAVLLIGFWMVGGTAIIYLAALRNVPPELYEAATLDGAGALARFRHITWPTISPITLFQLVVGVIGGLQIFTQPYLLAQDGFNSGGGGAQDSMLTLGTYIFQTAFTQFRMGYASAIAWLLFLVTLLVSGLVLAGSRRWVHYDA